MYQLLCTFKEILVIILELLLSSLLQSGDEVKDKSEGKEVREQRSK